MSEHNADILFAFEVSTKQNCLHLVCYASVFYFSFYSMAFLCALNVMTKNKIKNKIKYPLSSFYARLQIVGSMYTA